jgi:ADP-ribose pyrophosphatase YjhB (NUDIX family)
VVASANREYCGIEKVEIEQAATNSFDGSDPHVWFVLFTVYAKSHAPCDLGHPGMALTHQTFERGGSFYLDTKDGWVWMPEERFPEFIGNWMEKLDLAGPGDSTHVPRN